METVCDPSSFHFFFWMVYWRGVSLHSKKKLTVLNHRNLVYQKRPSNSFMPFSVVLVMTSIGRNVHCPTYTHLAGQNSITPPHDGGKNRQARDLCDSTHSLRHIASVCVPCCWFFFQSAGKSQFQHLFRDTVVKAWQTPPIELQCDSTLTSSYQASISHLPSESADVFPLLSCSSQQADENSATLPKEFTESPSHCPCRFHAVVWSAQSLWWSFLCLNGCSHSTDKLYTDFRQTIRITRKWNGGPWSEQGWPFQHF